MSFVVTIPEALAAVATDLAGIGSTIGTANAAAGPDHDGVGRRRR